MTVQMKEIEIQNNNFAYVDELVGRLEILERELMEKISEGFDVDSIEDDDLREKLETHEGSFADDIGRYCIQLIGKREREWNKSQQDLDRQIRRLREEKEKRDEILELNLVAEMKAYFRKEKKEFDKQRERLLKMNKPTLNPITNSRQNLFN